LELPARLAKALLRIVDAEGAQAANLAGTECHLSQSELANLVGAARESVNKCLHAWQDAGIVRMEKRVIKIADRPALEALAEME
jgi:CRP/FNR family cyclic AMP-dependent transcriptional regulator